MSDIPEIGIKKGETKKKKPKNTPETELETKDEAKKITTKMMLHQALTDLKNRKGTSLQAIKKYLQEKFAVDVVKNNHIIKKVIKNELEAGTVVQKSGTGVSGSFKLVTVTKKNEKIVQNKETTKKTKDKKDDVKIKTKEEKQTEPTKKNTKKKKVKKADKIEQVNPADDEEVETKKAKTSKASKAKVMKTPAKKRADMLKRKSIGSIIKPPKMKPKMAKA